MAARIPDIEGHSMGLDFKATKSRGDYGARSLAIRLEGPLLSQKKADGWVESLAWSDSERHWRTVNRPESMQVERLRIHRWGHIFPIPHQVWVEIHDATGKLLHQQEMLDEFYFTPPSGPKQIRLRRLDEDGVYTTIAVLKDDVWQALDSWPEAAGLAGTLTFRVPDYQLASKGKLLAPLGPRSRRSPLAERAASKVAG
jgi:hypothetical protein